jgi:hypothetical protein
MPIFMPFQNQGGPGPVQQAVGAAGALRADEAQRDLSQRRLEAEGRRTALAERAQGLEEMASAWKVLPPGSPQRIELMQRFYGMAGGGPVEFKVPPQQVEAITERVAKSWARTSAEIASGKRLPQDAMGDFAETYLAAFKEVATAPGTDANDRMLASQAVRDVGRTGLAGIEAQGGTVEHGIRQGQAAAAQIGVEGFRQRGRMDLERERYGNRDALQGERLAATERQIGQRGRQERRGIRLRGKYGLDQIGARGEEARATEGVRTEGRVIVEGVRGSQQRATEALRQEGRLGEVAARMEATLTTDAERARYREELERIRGRQSRKTEDKRTEGKLTVGEAKAQQDRLTVAAESMYGAARDAARIEGETGGRIRVAEATAIANRERRLAEIGAQLDANLTEGEARRDAQEALEALRWAGRFEMDGNRAQREYEGELREAERDLEMAARKDTGAEDRIRLSARLRRRQSVLDGFIRESGKKSGLSSSERATAFNHILKDQIERGRLETSEYTAPGLTSEQRDGMVEGRVRRAGELASTFLDSFAPTNPEQADTFADFKARMGVGRLRDRAAQIAAQGASPEAAALGAISDEMGPSLAYGMPAPGEAAPDVMANELSERLALYEEANPSLDPMARGMFLRDILKAGGYIGADGRILPEYQESFGEVLREAGLAR